LSSTDVTARESPTVAGLAETLITWGDEPGAAPTDPDLTAEIVARHRPDVVLSEHLDYYDALTGEGHTQR
jgi:prophage tail gpP-like protein